MLHTIRMVDLVPSIGKKLLIAEVKFCFTSVRGRQHDHAIFGLKGIKKLNGCDYNGEILNGKAHGKGAFRITLPAIMSS